MNFSDKKTRKNLDIVYVVRTEAEMNSRDEYNSLLWDVKRENIIPGKNLYSVPVRDVKIGENICKSNGWVIAYRID